MSKRTVIVFATIAIFVVVGMPLWATSKEADSDSSIAAVAAEDEAPKSIFHENCGPCHTLKRGGADGIVGPDLDASPAATNAETVVGFIENGSQGRMPAGILHGERAKRVAEFVAKYAGQ